MQLGMLASQLVLLESFGLSTVEIEKQIEDKKFEIRSGSVESQSDFLRERNATLKEYNLLSLVELQSQEEKALKEKYDKGLLTEEEYQRALLNIKLTYVKEYIDKYQNINSQLTEFTTNLRDAELTKLEARENEELQLAGNNAEKKKKIEEKFAKQKKAISKKYALFEFALKVSEIIASTAASIIQLWVKPGFPAAIPLSILVGAIGVSQLIKANAEKEKIMSMDTGGHTGPGSKYQVKGIVHANEYVIPPEELARPEIRSFVSQIIEPTRIRRLNNYGPYSHTGNYSDGGYTSPSGYSQPGLQSQEINELKSMVALNNHIMSRILKEGVNANFDQGKIYEMRKNIQDQENIEGRARKN